MTVIPDEVQQRAEWRTRLTVAVLERKHDDETLSEMLRAGLNQAHSEGLMDAVHILEQIAKQRPAYAPVLDIITVQLRKLDEMNAKISEEILTHMEAKQ